MSIQEEILELQQQFDLHQFKQLFKEAKYPTLYEELADSILPTVTPELRLSKKVEWSKLEHLESELHYALALTTFLNGVRNYGSEILEVSVGCFEQAGFQLAMAENTREDLLLAFFISNYRFLCARNSNNPEMDTYAQEAINAAKMVREQSVSDYYQLAGYVYYNIARIESNSSKFSKNQERYIYRAYCSRMFYLEYVRKEHGLTPVTFLAACEFYKLWKEITSGCFPGITYHSILDSELISLQEDLLDYCPKLGKKYGDFTILSRV